MYFDLFRMGNVAVTPECRLHLGKGYLHGFYISAYGRYARFDITASVQFTSSSNGTTEHVLFSGKVKAFSGGIMFEVQYTLWKIVVLDIMLIGGHYGSCSSTLYVNNINPPLSAQDQKSFQQNIDDIDAKPFKISVLINQLAKEDRNDSLVLEGNTTRLSDLNRHAILHGESIDYGTKSNSIKAILLLDFIENLHLLNIVLEEKLEERSSEIEK